MYPNKTGENLNSKWYLIFHIIQIVDNRSGKNANKIIVIKIWIFISLKIRGECSNWLQCKSLWPVYDEFAWLDVI